MTGYFSPTEITLRELPDSTFKMLVDDDLTFVDADDVRWIAPMGTWTDGASVPRLALGVTDGRFESMFLKAAVVHDAYCQKENEDRRPPFRSRRWNHVHEMFHEACIAGGTPRLRARLMFAAVYWFGPRWDDPKSEARKVPSDVARVGFSATKQWVEKEEPGLGDIAADVAQREGEIMVVHRLQAAALAAIDNCEFNEAAARLTEADLSLSARLERSPDDLMYLNLQGYQHKNWSMLRPAAKAEELGKAEHLFQRVLAVEPRDVSALNGLGSVAILRDDLEQAERFIVQALELEPDYQAARNDLELVREAAGQALEPEPDHEEVSRSREGVMQPIDAATAGHFNGIWEQSGLNHFFAFVMEIQDGQGRALTTTTEHFKPGDPVLRMTLVSSDRFAGECLSPGTGDWIEVMGTLKENTITLDWAGGWDTTLYRK